MDLSIKRESWGAGDQTWIGSRHGTNNAQTVTLDVASFSDFGDTIPSGVPLKRLESGHHAPVSDAGDTLAGFLFTDQPNTGTVQVAPMLWHGLIRVANLPEGAFDVSTLTAGNPAFVYKED